MNIEDLIIKLSHDPFNPQLNFEAARKYEEINQSASAVSFYLRTAEYGYATSPTLVYTSLCKLAKCFEDQKDRVWAVSNSLLQAIQYQPSRPEAYFLLSRFYEQAEQWQEAYTWAELGLRCHVLPPLEADVGYYGRFCLLFQKAVAGFSVGRSQESKELLLKLRDTDLPPDYKKAVEENLGRLHAAI